MSGRHTPRPEARDARDDVHGHALAYISDQDRAWFEAHPGLDTYWRAPFEHELCDPGAAADGRCEPYPVPPGYRPEIEVHQVFPGMRTRQITLVPEEAPT